MKNRTYVLKCYIEVNEEEALDYAISARGCKDEDEFFKMGYTVTDEDWRGCADDKFCYYEYDSHNIEFLEEIEE